MSNYINAVTPGHRMFLFQHNNIQGPDSNLLKIKRHFHQTSPDESTLAEYQAREKETMCQGHSSRKSNGGAGMWLYTQIRPSYQLN